MGLRVFRAGGASAQNKLPAKECTLVSDKKNAAVLGALLLYI